MLKSFKTLPFLLLGISGCATTPKVVQVPIPVPCFKGELPLEVERIRDKLTGNAEADIRIIAANNIRLRASNEELRAMLSGCKAD